MTEINLTAFDGRNFSAYIARPAQSSAPAIVVCQEIFGVNAAMRHICDDLAKQGYLAICPDLFWRQERGIQLSDQSDEEMQIAFKLYGEFNIELGVVDLLAAIGHVRKMEGCNGAVGTVGYCLGGKLAFLLMSRTDVDCGVSYYGVGLDEILHEVQDIRRPLLMHMAENDKFVSLSARNKILEKIARNPHITAHVYLAVDHAFARPAGVHFNATAAKIANERTTAFFAANLRR